MSFPNKCKYIIIGAGIHGLSTAWHLAKELKSRGKGSGEDIIVIDKEAIGAGASGIACGIIRNNYFQPAMRDLIAHSVSIWEEDGETENVIYDNGMNQPISGGNIVVHTSKK